MSLATRKDATSFSSIDLPTETLRGFLPFISELIGLKVDLLVVRGTPAALAVKQATRTIPVIMAVGEPLLIVDSLARPGGNITGLSGVQPELETKRLELLMEMAPGCAGVAALLNLGNPVTAPQREELERAARVKGLPSACSMCAYAMTERARSGHSRGALKPSSLGWKR